MAWVCRSLGRRAFVRTAVPLGIAGCAWGWQRASVRPASCSQGEKTSRSEDAIWTAGESVGNHAVLGAKFDLYGGVIVKHDEVPKDATAFRRLLGASLSEWRGSKKKGVWLRIGIESADLIPIATSDFGFEFHHAEKDHVMLTRWLPEATPSTLPSNASHTVGVGAVCTDDDNRILLVRERSGPAARINLWKVPTGLVDPGEELFEAALREIKEETGVDAEFEHIGGFTLSHQGNLAHAGKSNMFFMVKCRAISTDIRAQDGEIAEARWFTREECDALPSRSKDTVWDALHKSALSSGARCNTKQLPVGFRPGNMWFYYPSTEA